MEGLVATTSCASSGRFLLPPLRFTRNLSFSFRRRRLDFFPVLSSRDGLPSDLNQWDQMELKFGKLIGEDPKLTLAKIIGRKENPNASYLDIEKSFQKKKNKGKSTDDDIVEVPLDWAVDKQNEKQQKQQEEHSQQLLQLSSSMGLRPPTRGKKNSLNPELNLKRPVSNKDGNKNVKLEEKVVSTASGLQVSGKSSVFLRKPDVVKVDDIELQKPRFQDKPNFSLKMRKGGLEDNSSEMNLLNKPEIMKISLKTPDESNGLDDSSSEMNLLNKPEIMKISLKTPDESNGLDDSSSGMELLNKPEIMKISLKTPDENNASSGDNGISEKTSTVSTGVITVDEKSRTLDMKGVAESAMLNDRPEKIYNKHHKEEATTCDNLDENSVEQDQEGIISPSSLIEKPQRIDTLSNEINHQVGGPASIAKSAVQRDAIEEFLISTEQEEHEDSDWKRAEALLPTGERTEVELVSGSSRGFVVSFGTLIGFLPYRNLGAKWKFLAFESWLRKNGLNPSLYRQNLSIVGNYAVQAKDLLSESNESQIQGAVGEEKLDTEIKLEELLEMYDVEKTKFLSSFVGQRTKVAVAMVDRKSRKLIFSGRPKEKEEVTEKKRALMAKLNVGDIVKCCIKKITYFGIFVEIEGVPALIHQSEVSWDAALDPTSYFKIGQMLDAKVHQLDFSLERIALSLQEITPDPLNEALESVLGDSIEASQQNVEWADVESLIREVEQIDGVISVSKGRFFLSPGLAPTFQVYMASVYENKYKLLARFENKVQEVIVQASLDKDQMKSAILTCTNRVE